MLLTENAPEVVAHDSTTTYSAAQILNAEDPFAFLSACDSNRVTVRIPTADSGQVDLLNVYLQRSGYTTRREMYTTDGIEIKGIRVDAELIPGHDVEDYLARSNDFRKQFEAMREQLAPAEFWYPYGSLSNWIHLNKLLTGDHRNIAALINNEPVADIGCADGDMAFYLESEGATVDAVDYPPTNFDGMEGIRKLKEGFNSNITIIETDLDARFELPRDRYGLALFLGTLYHLKNPYGAMESLAKRCKWCLVSTRVTRNDQDGNSIAHIPAAYLVAPRECNNDPSNYWLFTNIGLQRMFDRAGWEIADYTTVGDTENSNPFEAHHDERAFALLRSRSVH